MATTDVINTSTEQIKEWRSIVTLIVFCLANFIVLFPFDLPIYVPVQVVNAVLDVFASLRIISPRQTDSKDRPQVQCQDAAQEHVREPSPSSSQQSSPSQVQNGFFHNDGTKETFSWPKFVRLKIPMNSVTAPLIADLFLLAILAIGKQEIHDGTIGQNGIHPLDIMIFFLTLAYIAISIDASGLIRWLALKVLLWGGKVGHKLFFYLYAFFFCLGAFIGNDPIILSGTAFLAYMTRVSKNIGDPKAWIFSQFAVANIASAILVSSNPTNLVLAGAFDIKFIEYTANMVVPVVVTAIVVFPFLLYIIFSDQNLIPVNIDMFELPPDTVVSEPVNPNIPNRSGESTEDELLRSTLEIMNPWIDWGGAAFGAVIMSATLVTVLALNAASVKTKEDQHLQVFWVTLPAAFIMLCWDLGFGWIHRHETREISRKGQRELRYRAEQETSEESNRGSAQTVRGSAESGIEISPQSQVHHWPEIQIQDADAVKAEDGLKISDDERPSADPENKSHMPQLTITAADSIPEGGSPTTESRPHLNTHSTTIVENTHHVDGSWPSSSELSAAEKRDGLPPPQATDTAWPGVVVMPSNPSASAEKQTTDQGESGASGSGNNQKKERATLVSICRDRYQWLQETFPTVMAVIGHLPFALVPFAFAMFVLVQALVTKGWVPWFAHGWDHWVEKTGTIGAIGGMGFLSVILCNFAGTNIGTTILLSRVIQAWHEINRLEGTAISDRTFWATVYSMALGVNYGAFSTAFSASLAGLLWRDILERKYIMVSRRSFARENIPIIAIAMTVGCTVLTGEVYLMRKDTPYEP